jgi:hypothetical protein
MPQFQEMDVRDLQVEPKPRSTELELQMGFGVPGTESELTGEELDARDRDMAAKIQTSNEGMAADARRDGYDVSQTAAPSPYGDMYNP